MSSNLTEVELDTIVKRYTTRLPDGSWEGTTAIARDYGISAGSVSYWLRKRGVEIRDRKESHEGKRCKPIKNLPQGAAPACACECGGSTSWNQRKNKWNRYATGHHSLRSQPGHYGWITDPDYDNNHKYLKRHHPKTGTCEECGKSARTDYALIKGRAYSRDRNDYRELCRSCHMIYDASGGAPVIA